MISRIPAGRISFHRSKVPCGLRAAPHIVSGVDQRQSDRPHETVSAGSQGNGDARATLVTIAPSPLRERPSRSHLLSLQKSCAAFSRSKHPVELGERFAQFGTVI